MKKIPTLFKREYADHKVVAIHDEITPGCEEAFLRGDATVKYDGACCAVINGELYKRYDAKKGKKPPEGAIPCCDPDPVTGHWPHWVKVDKEKPEDKWFVQAAGSDGDLKDGTYEAIGPHFQSNPYDLPVDLLVPHGKMIINGLFRCFAGVRNYLQREEIEGIVFWLDGEPVCKIKRSDFGFEWPVKNKHGL